MDSNINYSDMVGNYQGLAKKIVLVWNLFSIALYTSFSLVVILKDYGSTYTNILLVLLVLYVLIYLSIAILKYVGNKKNILILQDGMSIITILKKILNIANLGMSILAIISSFDIRDISNTFSLIVMIVSIILASIQILIAIFKMWLRRFIKKKASSMQDVFKMFNTAMLTNGEEDK